MTTHVDSVHPVPVDSSKAAKEGSTIMATEKGSQTSSPPTTHTENLTAEHPQHPAYRHSTVDGQPAYGEHGPLVDHKISQENVIQSEPDLRW